MDVQYFMYGLIGIVVLFLVLKLLKWPLKVLFNGIIGVIILYVVNIIGSNLNLIGLNYNFSLPINPITALVSGFFGVPGVVVIMIVVYLL